MKLTVRITGVLEAELEMPEPATGNLLNMPNNLGTWNADRFHHLKLFVMQCSDEAQKIIKQQQHFLEQ